MGKAAALVEGFVRKESPEASAEPAGETRGHVLWWFCFAVSLTGWESVRAAVLNLWVVTGSNDPFTGSPETIRKHRYLHYDSYQHQNYS